MMEFFRNNWAFLILVTIIGSFVGHSLWSENKEKEKTRKKEKNDNNHKD